MLSAYKARAPKTAYERLAYDRGWQRYSEHVFLFYASRLRGGPGPDRPLERAYSAATKAELVRASYAGHLGEFLEERETVARRILAMRRKVDPLLDEDSGTAFSYA